MEYAAVAVRVGQYDCRFHSKLSPVFIDVFYRLFSRAVCIFFKDAGFVFRLYQLTAIGWRLVRRLADIDSARPEPVTTIRPIFATSTIFLNTVQRP